MEVTVCAECDTIHVQTVSWVSCVDGGVRDEFGSFNEEDTRWCETCQAHSELDSREATPAEFAEVYDHTRQRILRELRDNVPDVFNALPRDVRESVR